jgi:hypothetical protein
MMGIIIDTESFYLTVSSPTATIVAASEVPIAVVRVVAVVFYLKKHK